MTSRERLLTVIRGEIPDCVPVAPDTSNMIPARLTGLPFWDIYLYNKVPLWKAYIDCVKHFGFDSLMDGYFELCVQDDDKKWMGNWGYMVTDDWEEMIILKDERRIITQQVVKDTGYKQWTPSVTVYHRDNPPVTVHPSLIGLPLIPEKYEPVEGKTIWPRDVELLKLAKAEMGDHGLVGAWCGTSMVIGNEEAAGMFMDDPDPFYERREWFLDFFERRFCKLMELEVRPDFICMGGSGTLIFQTPNMFREISLPVIKKMSALCKKFGIPSHIHSCGPAAELVQMVHDETDLTMIDPLEMPPMGNCNLAELKKKYGEKLILKGNLHTTDHLLNGTTETVINAAKYAIDVAAYGGKFILSTGDQCGRDTPDENLFAMIETARTYGKY